MKRLTFISTLLASLPALLLGRRQPDDSQCRNGHEGTMICNLYANIGENWNKPTPNWYIRYCGMCNEYYTVYTPTLKRRTTQPNAPLN